MLFLRAHGIDICTVKAPHKRKEMTSQRSLVPGLGFRVKGTHATPLSSSRPCSVTCTVVWTVSSLYRILRVNNHARVLRQTYQAVSYDLLTTRTRDTSCFLFLRELKCCLPHFQVMIVIACATYAAIIARLGTRQEGAGTVLPSAGLHYVII